MEQTENEFGIPYKEPKVKNEEQEAVEQPASEEQPKTDEEEEIGEEARVCWPSVRRSTAVSTWWRSCGLPSWR